MFRERGESRILLSYAEYYVESETILNVNFNLQRYEASELQMYLPSKKDYVLFIRLAKLQATLYKQYISLIMHNDNIKKETLFQHYHNLQMVWNHPMLLNLKEKQVN